MNTDTTHNSAADSATATTAPAAATEPQTSDAVKAVTSEPIPVPPPETQPTVAPAPPSQPRLLPDHTLRLGYELVLLGGRHEVLHVKSELTLPLALELENLAQTDLAFPELVDAVIVRPMVARFRNFIQLRYDVATTAAQKQKTAAAEPTQFQQPASAGIQQPGPVNGTGLPGGN